MRTQAALLLVLLVVTAASSPHLIGATETTTPEQLWTRHAPIIGNLTLTAEELQQLLGSLLNATTDPELAEILDGMNTSLAMGDEEGYNNATTELQEYLANLSSGEIYADMVLDPATLEKLALLASTNMQEGGGQANADLNLYAQFLEQLVESGLLGEAEPLSGELTPEDLVQTLEDMGFNESETASKKTPLEVAKSPPPLPSASLPSTPSLSAQGVTSQLITAFKLIVIFAVIMIASYLAYMHRHRLLQVSERLASRITARAKTWAAQRAKTPRDAIIACFGALVSAASRLGYPKNRWETAKEYASRLASRGFGQAVIKVASLYNKAKFSTHEVTWDDVEECVTCVREVSSR